VQRRSIAEKQLHIAVNRISLTTASAALSRP
jgi:hypothetical protein